MQGVDGTVFVAVCSAAASIVGSISGILISSKLTTYRLEQLEKKVEKHNNVVERITKMEKTVEFVCEDMRELKGAVHNV